MVRSLMEKASTLGKLEEMCNKTDAAGKTPFDMAAAGQHKASPLVKMWKEKRDESRAFQAS